MHRGCRGFSAQIDRLMDNRVYRPGTVDAVLQDNAVLVTPDQFEVLSAPPDIHAYRLDELRERRVMLTALAGTITQQARSGMERLEALARFTRQLESLFPSPDHPASQFYRSPDEFWWGGTEEMVIAKGSDWCAEVARVYVGLAQVLGIPSRVVFTYGQSDGHVIAECWVDESWVLVDPLSAKLYHREDGSLLGAVGMAAATPVEREALTAGHEGYYVNAEFFQFVLVAEYRLIEAGGYDYGISRCNPFYRDLLGPMWNQG